MSVGRGLCVCVVPPLLWAAMCITHSPWAHLLCCPWIRWAHMAVLGSAHLTPTLVFLSAAPMVPHRLTLEPGQDLTSTALVWPEQGFGAFLFQHGSERRLDTLCSRWKWEKGKGDFSFQGLPQASMSLQKASSFPQDP